MALEKKYLYKIYRNGTFLGVLPTQYIKSEFGYSQQINNAGSQCVITLQKSAAESRDAPDFLMTEDGDFLITEDGDFLVTERSDPIFGNDSDKALIRNNNDVKIYEYSTANPNGLKVFEGYISKIKAKFGADTTMEATVLSYGAELDNFLIQGSSTLDNSQATGTDEIFIFSGSGDKDVGWNRAGQSFLAGASAVNLSKLIAKLRAATATDVTVTLSVYDNSNFTGTPLGTTTRLISGTSAAEYEFIFTSPITLTPGGTYYFSLTTDSGSATGAYVLYKSGTNAYANGTMYNSNYAGGSGGGGWYPVPIGTYAADSDLYFKTYYTAGATDVPFSSTDPATIAETIVDNFNAQGGDITTGTIDLTGTTVTYSFKINTVLEGIKKCLELSPANFYWYIDPATSIFHFRQISTTAHHVMVLGRHIENLEIELNIERVKNVVYFSGGDTGSGDNLFTSDSDATSLANIRQGLAKISDNRVTVSATAAAIMQNFLDNNADELYITSITITADRYDITTMDIGEIVGFGGFGNFIDLLLLQIVSINRKPNSVTLNLGVLPRRATADIEAILNSITDLETVNNPSAPS